MELCPNCDIVYDSRNCPLCEANDKISDMDNQITNLKDEISDLTSTISDLEKQIEYLNEPLLKAVREAISD